MRPNMIIVKFEDGLHEIVLTGDGTMIGYSRAIKSDYYNTIKTNEISFVEFKNNTSIEMIRYTIANENDSEGEFSVEKSFMKQTLQKIVSKLFNMVNDNDKSVVVI